MTDYPKRESHFAHKAVRLLMRTCAAQDMGIHAAWLVSLIAHTEDAAHYRGAVTFWNDQLITVGGFGTRGKLDRARKRAIQAGWLHYEPGGKEKIGRYWVTIPPTAVGLPDHPVDEDDPIILSTLEQEDGLSCPPVDTQTSGNRREDVQENVGKTCRKTSGYRAPFKPDPKPSPGPDPDPTPKKSVASATPCRPAADRSVEVRAVFDHYRTYHPKAPPKPKASSKEWRAVRARLDEGFAVEDLKAAIDGNHRSPFHSGENDRGKRYHDLTLIMRDGSHVTRFIEEPDGEPVLTEKERRSLRAAESWIQRMDKWDQANDQSSRKQ